MEGQHWVEQQPQVLAGFQVANAFVLSFLASLWQHQLVFRRVLRTFLVWKIITDHAARQVI